jgi:hypothetical protein
MSSRSTTWSRVWIIASIAYGGLRTALVWRFLHQYGVNVWVFGIIELFASALYGLSSARVVTFLLARSWSHLRPWGVLTFVSYAIPDVYVFASAGTLPGSYLDVLIGIVFVTAVLTAIGIVGQVRKGRALQL